MYVCMYVCMYIYIYIYIAEQTTNNNIIVHDNEQYNGL